MNKFFIAVSGSAAALAMVSGCYYTEIATPASSPEMQEWEKVIMESYPGYRPPKVTSKNYKGQPESRYSKTRKELTPMKDLEPANNSNVSETPAKEEEEVVEIKLEEPVDKQQEEKLPAAEEVKKETPAVEEVKAEEPAEEPAKEEAKAEEPAKEEAKAEEPAKEEAKAEEPAKEEAKAEEPAKEEAKAEEPAKEEAKAEEPAKEEAKAEEPAGDGNMPPDPTNSTVYEVKAGDTLSAISQKMYGNARFSNVIFKANGDILKDPNKLRPGMKLIIPKL